MRYTQGQCVEKKFQLDKARREALLEAEEITKISYVLGVSAEVACKRIRALGKKEE